MWRVLIAVAIEDIDDAAGLAGVASGIALDELPPLRSRVR
jgi:hypothetical protein